MTALITDATALFTGGVAMLSTFASGGIDVVYITLVVFVGGSAIALFQMAKNVVR